MTLNWLTTEDNPFDVFDEYDKWLSFDLSHGYNTDSKIARIAKISTDNLSLEENNKEINYALMVVMDLNPEIEYIKVSKTI